MAAASAKETASTKVITPVAMASYPHLFKAQAAEDGGDPKFSIALVFPEGTDLSALRAAAEAAATAKFGAKGPAMLRDGKIRSPFRTDGEEKGYPKGSTFLNARSADKPTVVSRFAGPDGKAQIITDEKAIYAGAFVKASIAAFGYERKGNKGVAFALNNVQKWEDGARIDGRKKAEDEFAADLSGEPDSLDDLTNS